MNHDPQTYTQYGVITNKPPRILGDVPHDPRPIADLLTAAPSPDPGLAPIERNTYRLIAGLLFFGGLTSGCLIGFLTAILRTAR